MKTVSNELLEHISGEVTSLAHCWKISRTDDVVMGFTDHSQDIVFDGITYIAESGFIAGKSQQTLELGGDDMLLQGILDNALIQREDIIAGLYDFAEIEIFILNYEDISQGKLVIRGGWFGEIEIRNGDFSVQMHGLGQRLEKTIGNLYSPSCRATLGDSKCQVDVQALEVSGSVTATINNRKFDDTSRTEDNGYFNYGKITFTSGENQGLSMEIKEFRDGNFTLALPMPYDIAIGNSFTLIPGCNKSFGTCQNKFNNVINFRGEPHVPGVDAILKTSGTR